MIRREAIEIAAKKIGNQPIIAANGFISRDLYEKSDKDSNFYMIGSMGLASSIGLGIAMRNPKKRIFIFDGDGNILMNIGSLTTIGSIKPRNLVHLIFDNSSHESTGGQPTISSTISLQKIAKATNYSVFNVSTKKNLLTTLERIKGKIGPIFIHVQVKKSKYKSKRIILTPKQIKDRFMNFLEKK